MNLCFFYSISCRDHRAIAPSKLTKASFGMASTSQTYERTWQTSMNHAMQAIVTIHAASPFSFGSQSLFCGKATGFVVDTDTGIILMNRQFLSDAPMHARAIVPSETRQCPIKPLYIDPTHDFAFCQYDLKILQGLSPIQLRPDLATMSRQIRVLGNDKEQVMSILPGFISRVNINPPWWDEGRFLPCEICNSRFDTTPGTPYIQASTDTTEGSPGSPVIIQDGSAVAMVSGGFHEATTDLLLPLDLPLRTLQNLRLGKPTPRGTIQSRWRLERPAHCYTRGLSYEEIEAYSPDGSGLLVAQSILPDGPSDTHVKEADILRTVDDQIVTSLLLFEKLINDAVGATVNVRVQRNGKPLQFELQVQDLWTLTPFRLLQYAGDVFQDLRYQTAFDYHLPLKGVILLSDDGSFMLE